MMTLIGIFLQAMAVGILILVCVALYFALYESGVSDRGDIKQCGRLAYQF